MTTTPATSTTPTPAVQAILNAALDNIEFWLSEDRTYRWIQTGPFGQPDWIDIHGRGWTMDDLSEFHDLSHIDTGFNAFGEY